MTNTINQSPYLRTSRDFPVEDLEQLNVELVKSYIDIASNINVRTIGLFPTTKSAITGESWYLKNNQRQQSLRQAYTFTTTADIPIGFKFSTISQFSRAWGVYTDGINWYGIMFGTSGAIPNQISFYIALNGASTTSDSIKFVVDAGAPALTSGTIVIEWLSNA